MNQVIKTSKICSALFCSLCEQQHTLDQLYYTKNKNVLQLHNPLTTKSNFHILLSEHQDQ